MKKIEFFHLIASLMSSIPILINFSSSSPHTRKHLRVKQVKYNPNKQLRIQKIPKHRIFPRNLQISQRLFCKNKWFSSVMNTTTLMSVMCQTTQRLLNHSVMPIDKGGRYLGLLLKDTTQRLSKWKINKMNKSSRQRWKNKS